MSPSQDREPMVTAATIEGIFIAGAAREALTPVAEVRAVEGRGLEGDRYHAAAGSFSRSAAGSVAAAPAPPVVQRQTARARATSIVRRGRRAAMFNSPSGNARGPKAR